MAILIVAQNEINLKLLIKYLEDTDVKHTDVLSGKDAINCLHKILFDCVLLIILTKMLYHYCFSAD